MKQVEMYDSSGEYIKSGTSYNPKMEAWDSRFWELHRLNATIVVITD